MFQWDDGQLQQTKGSNKVSVLYSQLSIGSIRSNHCNVCCSLFDFNVKQQVLVLFQPFMFTVNIFSPRNDLYLRVSYMYCYYFNAFRKSNSSLSSLFIYQIVHILTYVNVRRGSRSLIEVKGHICQIGLSDCQRHSFLSTSCYYEIALKLILIVELTY